MPQDRIFSRAVPSRRPCLTAVLRMAGLRPTRQRVALAEILFGGEHRHVSAEELLAEANAAKVNVSLATIYNTLHQFRTSGLLREVAVDANATDEVELAFEGGSAAEEGGDLGRSGAARAARRIARPEALHDRCLSHSDGALANAAPSRR